MNIRWIRGVIVVAIICAAILAAGYRLTQSEPNPVAAAPALTDSVPLKKVSLDAQATTLEEVQARDTQAVVEPMATFEDEHFGYHLSYPASWETDRLSANVVLFQSVNHLFQRDYAGRGDYSCLPHASANYFSHLFGFVDEFFCADHD